MGARLRAFFFASVSQSRFRGPCGYGAPGLLQHRISPWGNLPESLERPRHCFTRFCYLVWSLALVPKWDYPWSCELLPFPRCGVFGAESRRMPMLASRPSPGIDMFSGRIGVRPAMLNGISAQPVSCATVERSSISPATGIGWSCGSTTLIAWSTYGSSERIRNTTKSTHKRFEDASYGN